MDRAKCLFADDHLAYYEKAGLVYPPCWADDDPALTETIAELTERAQEVCLYADKVDPKLGVNEPQFVDVNLSLKFMLGQKGTNKCLRSHIPMLATTSTLLMRCLVEKPDGTRGMIYRIIRGKWLLHILGFGDPMNDEIDNDICQLLAGNAFSAFACVPLTLCLLANFYRPFQHAHDILL